MRIVHRKVVSECITLTPSRLNLYEVRCSDRPWCVNIHIMQIVLDTAGHFTHSLFIDCCSVHNVEIAANTTSLVRHWCSTCWYCCYLLPKYFTFHQIVWLSDVDVSHVVPAVISYYDIVDRIRMTWSVPAAVPQMMKLMKHTVIWSLLLYWRLSTWIGKHLFIIL